MAYVRKLRRPRVGKRRVDRKKPRNMLQRRYKYRIPTAPANRTRMYKLRYQQVNTLTSTAGNIASLVFRANDLYDPYQTGIGHQALYRDQLFAMYEHARVLAVAIKVTICTSGTTVGQSVWKVILQKATSGTTDTDTNLASERPGSQCRIVQGYSGLNMMKTYSTSDNYFGLRKGTTSTDSLFQQATGYSLTGDQSMWYIVYANDLTAAASSTCVINIELHQYTIFEEPLQVPSS